jgi:carbon monoxide dehydrogenase subunit G
MDMSGQERIEAPVGDVWRALNDPDMLRRCIPGCEALSQESDQRMAATVVLKIGPVKARFAGEVELTNLVPLRSYTITGEGRGGIAGFAKGSADVSLVEDGPDATMLSYSVKADVGGKIAQLGSRLIDATSRKLAAQFFSALRDELTISAEAVGSR